MSGRNILFIGAPFKVSQALLVPCDASVWAISGKKDVKIFTIRQCQNGSSEFHVFAEESITNQQLTERLHHDRELLSLAAQVGK